MVELPILVGVSLAMVMTWPLVLYLGTGLSRERIRLGRRWRPAGYGVPPGLGLAAVVALAAAYAVLAQGPGWNANAHYALVRALAEGTPTIDQTRYETGAWYPTGDIAIHEGHVYASQGAGTRVRDLPGLRRHEGRRTGRSGRAPDRAALVSHAVGRRAAGVRPAVSRPAGSQTSSSPEHAHWPPPSRWASATLVLPFSTIFFAHLSSAMLVFAVFAVLWYERRGPPGSRWVAAAGLLAGYSITTEFPNAIAACLLGLYALARSDTLKRALAFGGGALVGLVPLLLYNQWAFGSPVHLAYQSTVGFGDTGTLFLTTPSFRRAIEVLFAPAGLLRVTPVVAMGVVGIVLLYRRGVRVEALLVAAIAAAYLFFEASFAFPFGRQLAGPAVSDSRPALPRARLRERV